MTPEEREEYIKQLVAEAPPLPESVIARDDATYWWAQAVTFLATSGLIWVAFRRIRGAVQDAVRSHGLHRLVADSASDIIWSMSPPGRFTYVSPAVERVLGEGRGVYDAETGVRRW